MFLWVIKKIHLDKVEDSEGIDIDKADNLKECNVCHDIYFNNGLKSDSKVCKSCNLGIESFGNFAIITVNDIDYRNSTFDMTEGDVIELIKDFQPNEL